MGSRAKTMMRRLNCSFGFLPKYICCFLFRKNDFCDNFSLHFKKKQMDMKYGVRGVSPCSRDVAVVTVSGIPSTL